MAIKTAMVMAPTAVHPALAYAPAVGAVGCYRPPAILAR